MQWSKNYGGFLTEYGSSYILPINGNYILGNSSASFGNHIDTVNAYVICINNLGDTIWTKVYGYNTYTDFIGGVLIQNNCIFLVGNSYNNNTGNNFTSISTKVNPNNGNVISSKKQINNARGEIYATIDGGAIMVGSTLDTNTSVFSSWINKIDTSYNLDCTESPITMREYNTKTVIGNPSTQQHNVATQVRSTQTQVGHGGVVSKLCYSIGIEQYEANGLQLTVYPNPNTGNFTISYNIEQNATLYIFDAQGKQVYSLLLSAEQKSIEVNNLNLANGIYMYKVLNSGNMLHNGKLIILK